ncbi:MAG: hypothetical protein A3J24_07715 [Deltaproteobacteria bacterium RIFCSPLOWO2_02_FULL_53_8]|nr:MAG: hypothetical protein A3J24_07715 [Deltaproteobacteria bacterium RIFCSPLOWO2_02_FULL_53_8]
MKVYIDTSAFCALTNPKDRHNLRAKEIYLGLEAARPIIHTSDYVLDEIYTLLRIRASHNAAVNFMNGMDKSNIIVLRMSEDIIEAAKTIFRRYDDKKLSFTDCTSFALINNFCIDAVFAFDEHFKYQPYSHTVSILE